MAGCLEDSPIPTLLHAQVAWPPGWGPERRVQCERDIFELLSVEYRPPNERNAP
jgi:hypothetical protein